jgi:hypothetical protein
MTIAVSFALISLSSLYVTPQIYKPIRQMLNTSTDNTHQTRRTRTESVPLKINATASPSITSKPVSADLELRAHNYLLQEDLISEEISYEKSNERL